MREILTLLIALSIGPSKRWEDQAYQYFGSAVGKVGDINHDAVADLVVGDPGYPKQGLPPRIWLISGADGKVLKTCSLEERALPLKNGDVRLCLDGGSDIDGDGIPDAIAGIRLWDGSGQSTVYEISGATGEILNRRQFPGGYPGCSWMRLIPDADHDGLADLAVCSDAEKSGSILLVSGKTGKSIANLKCQDDEHVDVRAFAIIDGVQQLPSAYLVLKKVRSGVSSLVVRGGARWSLSMYDLKSQQLLWNRQLTSPDRWEGAELAVLGASARAAWPDVVLGYGEQVEVVGSENGQTRFLFQMKDPNVELGLGCAVAGLGDVNKDGAAEFAYSEYDPGMNEGLVICRSGKTGDELWRVRGSLDDEVHHFGYQLANIGDVDGDSLADIFVGTDEGPDGVARGLAEVYSGRTGHKVYQFRRTKDDVMVMVSAKASSK